MKKLLVLVAFILFSAHSFGGVVATCRDSQMVAGPGALEPVNFSVVVNQDRNNYSAKIMLDGRRVPTEKQVAVNYVTAKHELDRLKSLLKFAKIPAAKAVAANQFDFHPYANQADGNGITLSVLVDSYGNIVGKVFSIGWGGGICK